MEIRRVYTFASYQGIHSPQVQIQAQNRLQTQSNNQRQALPQTPTAATTTVAPAVTQLRYSDIPGATHAYQGAFENDPVFRYIRNERPQTSLESFTERILVSAHLVHSIRAKIALTIDASGSVGGAANAVASPPKGHSAPPHDAITRLAGWVAKTVSQARRRANEDPEVARRRIEVDKKLEYAVIRSLGARKDKMWYMEEIWTSPEERGKGYGGKLIDTISFLADIAGTSTWLQSSNLANTPFYNTHGFETVETVLLGEDNPTWGGEGRKPVVVSIMVREPRWPPKVGAWARVEDFVL